MRQKVICSKVFCEASIVFFTFFLAKLTYSSCFSSFHTGDHSLYMKVGKRRRGSLHSAWMKLQPAFMMAHQKKALLSVCVFFFFFFWGGGRLFEVEKPVFWDVFFSTLKGATGCFMLFLWGESLVFGVLLISGF